MKSRLALAALAAVVAALLGVGCTNGDDSANDGDDDAMELQSDAGVRCPDGIPEFFAGDTSGMEAMGENEEIKARLISADHVPPHKYDNTWTIELMTPDGTPLPDAQIVKACAFMPVHGHGLPPRKINMLDDPGRFELKELNLSMRGPWEVQLAVSSESVPEAMGRATNCDELSRGTDFIVFSVCVKDD